MPERIIETPADFGSYIDELLGDTSTRSSAMVITLSGDLGAGKTTFTQVLARKLGVEGPVTSPTFVIMRIYPISHPSFKRLVHIDAYRIESDREIEVLHIPELFTDPENRVCIEWPEKIATLIPHDRVSISLTPNPDGSRTLIYGS